MKFLQHRLVVPRRGRITTDVKTSEATFERHYPRAEVLVKAAKGAEVASRGVRLPNGRSSSVLERCDDLLKRTVCPDDGVIEAH